jgi:hypothetical protein
MARLRENSIRPFFGLVCTALFLGVAATASSESDWEAARSTSDTMEDHQAHSENPDDLRGESETLDSHVVESEKLDDHIGHSENPDDMVAAPGKLADHEAESEELGTLSMDAPDAGARAIRMPGDDAWKKSTNPRAIVAGRNFERAQQRAEKARDNYGRMMRNDYPRGDARERIVSERDASMTALEEARTALGSATKGY